MLLFIFGFNYGRHNPVSLLVAATCEKSHEFFVTVKKNIILFYFISKIYFLFTMKESRTFLYPKKFCKNQKTFNVYFQL